MRRSNHTDAEIVALLKEAENGISIEEICATAYISTRTFYRWRKQLGGLAPAAIRRLRTLEQENQHLRLLVGRLHESNAGGVWSGFATGNPISRAECGVLVKSDGASGPPASGNRHEGSGASSGRFASLRAGRG